MSRRYLELVAFLGIAACTTPGPESPSTVETAGTSAIINEPSTVEGVLARASATETPAEAAVEDPDRIICIRERLTGSRIPKKVCMTHAEREKIRKINQENFENNKRRPGKNSPVD